MIELALFGRKSYQYIITTLVNMVEKFTIECIEELSYQTNGQ
jgi:hypothetical protein